MTRSWMATALVASVALAGCAATDPLSQSLGGLLQQAATGVPASASANPTLDSVGLKNILPPFDPDQPLSRQFPHVALSITRSPKGWSSTSIHLGGNVKDSGLFRGCWTLTAVVWSSESESRHAGPFDWCSPRDAQIQMAARSSMGLMRMVDRAYSTGIRRTDGPRPPATLFPEDRSEFPNGFVPQFSLSDTTVTAVWLMYGNVLYALGGTPGRQGDYRVWIAHIVD